MRQRIFQATASMVLLALAVGTAAAQCIGDADNNGFVNFADYGAVAANFGTSCAGKPYCGNGVIDLGEDCDFGNLNGGTCASEGFAGGVLRCGVGCSYDASGCYAVRFVDNRDGTISDNMTGLVWEKKVRRDSVTDTANAHDADNVYLWAGTCSLAAIKRCQPDAASAMACTIGADGDTTGCGRCNIGEGTCTVISPGTTVWQWLRTLNASNFAGYDDWRLANRAELLSIIDYNDASPPMVNVAFNGASCETACADLSNPDCSCTNAARRHLSASTSARGVANTFAVEYGGGLLDEIGKTVFPALARAVRGGY